MELISKQQVDHFLSCKTLAIAGASRHESSFSAQVAKHLTKLGYDLWYVNPGFEANESANKRLQSIAQLPEEVNHVLVLTNQTQTESVIQQVIEKGICNVWIQQQSDTPEALELAQKNGINLVHHLCIFMFSQPEGIHKFHHGIKKIFGRLPR